MSQRWYEWGYWNYRASVAQANGAGGAIVVDFTPSVGQTMYVVEARGINSGTNTVRIQRVDEDNNLGALYVTIASAATTVGSFPQTTAFAETSSYESTSAPGVWIRGDDKFSILQTGAGAQNDTLIVELRAFLSSSKIPSVSKARSTNQANVTIATPTINKIL